MYDWKVFELHAAITKMARIYRVEHRRVGWLYVYELRPQFLLQCCPARVPKMNSGGLGAQQPWQTDAANEASVNGTELPRKDESQNGLVCHSSQWVFLRNGKAVGRWSTNQINHYTELQARI